MLNWPHAKLRYVARLGYGDALPRDEITEGSFRVYGSNGPFSFCSRANTQGPAIIVGRKGSYGKVNWSAEPCFASDTTFYVDRSTTQNHLRWLYWLLQTLHLDVGCDEAAVPGLNRDIAYSKNVVVPPPAQQHAIADFLDRETARIDALIVEKDKLLGLLVERRRALIGHAVTRGLDAYVVFSDSGIPWLGMIPDHWETVALRFLVDFTGGATPNTGISEYWDGGIPWVSPKDMKRIEIRDAQDHVSQLALSKSALRLIDPGSVLIVVRGMILAHSFPTAVTTTPVTINQDMKALRCRAPLVPDFLRDFFRGVEEYVLSLTDASAHGTRKLETEVLGRLEIAVPPIEEQRAITDYICEATAKIDEVEAAARATISLLTERRSALISDAVSGKIDVERSP